MLKITYPALSVSLLRRVLYGVSLFAMAGASFGPLHAQDNFDLGVPVDGVATPVVEPSDEVPQPEAAANEPVAVAPLSVPDASDVPAAVVEGVPVDGIAAAQPVVEPVDVPQGDDLSSPSSEVEVVSPAPDVAPVAAVPAEPTVSTPSKSQGISKAEAAFEEDLFYDANDIVPEGELAKRSARKVNPKLEPGSKLIVVTRDSGPGSRAAQLVSANRALKLGRYEAALDIYQTLYEGNRKDPQVLMGVAVALQRMGNFDASIAAYQELLELQPKNTGAEVNMLGLMSEKYPAVALRRLEELRREKPSELGVVAQLAVTQAQLNNTPEALKYLAVAASMQPQNPNHVYNMAVIADRAGNRKEAVQFYEQALEMDSIYGGGRTLPRDVIFERLSRLR
ncbi:MAG: tetratricopeptide repeat protein [Alphaproteobacteria bacterium]|nr:tetratricopeptide repeat protein [Alphaproteobacteria bacterium]MCD8566570.1 tetratricopeptide repeat protein [Alphaproteobacteria bacterium]